MGRGLGYYVLRLFRAWNQYSKPLYGQAYLVARVMGKKAVVGNDGESMHSSVSAATAFAINSEAKWLSRSVNKANEA
jgi:hypothetical protein